MTRAPGFIPASFGKTFTFLANGTGRSPVRSQRQSHHQCSTWRRRSTRMVQTGEEEKFDLVDEENKPLGLSKARSRVHADGDWHRAVHVWLARPAVTSKGRPGQVLLQKRSATKDTFPGRWDISAAGHVASGDQSQPTALREVKEEIGLTLGGGSAMEFCFTARSVNSGETALHGPFLDREFQDVYMVEWDREDDSEEWKIQAEEVDGVAWFDWRMYRQSLEQGDPLYVPRPTEYQLRLFELLEDRYP